LKLASVGREFFAPVGALVKTDCGNPMAKSFAEIVKDWDLRLFGNEIIARGCVVVIHLN